MTVWNGMYPASARKAIAFQAHKAYRLARLENCTIYVDWAQALGKIGIKRLKSFSQMCKMA